MIDYKTHIEANPETLFGKPCIKGTRVPVDLILEKLGVYTEGVKFLNLKIFQYDFTTEFDRFKR